MQSTDKQCQNCKQSFVIEPEDFDFYEKIEVPPPTWCPECRMIRRMAFWNERSFFKRIDSSGKPILSTYPEESPLKIVDRDFWWSDGFDPHQYGRDYDFSKPFFKQFRELMFTVPFPSKSVFQVINSDYCNNSNNLKNCYMCFDVTSSEDSIYCVFCGYMKNSIDIINTGSSEDCYELLSSERSYQVFFGVMSNGCRESYFIYNCTDCSNCFGCVNLRHKQYHIFNEPYSKEDYFKKLAELNIGSYESLVRIRQKFAGFALNFPKRYITGSHNSNVIGEEVDRSKNIKYSFAVIEGENIKHSQALAGGVKDSCDYTNWGINSELIYEALECGINDRELKFCHGCSSGCQNLEYCSACVSSEDCFGCVGLKKAKYCILNKQYSKEEYETLRAKIITHMGDMPYADKKGRVYKYGEFFPLDLVPIAANESALIDFLKMPKEKALEMGLTWREPKAFEYKTTIHAADLADNIKDVAENITKEAIECASCKRAYRIIPKEFQFYKEHAIPLPRLCHNCRFAERIKNRNIPRWHNRQCQCAGESSENRLYENTAAHPHAGAHCPNTFITAWSPDKPDIIYCEECYQSEVI